MVFHKDEIVIEVDHAKNSPVYFRPAGKALRSRWITHRCGPGAASQLEIFNTHPIPGQRVHINLKGRYAKISDPLADPENKQLMELVNKANRQLENHIQNKPEDTEDFPRLVEVQVLSWMFYMLHLLEGFPTNLASSTDTTGVIRVHKPAAVLLHGEFPKEYPTTLELRQTGKILSYNPNPFRGESRYIEVLPKEELEALLASQAEA